MQKVLSIPLKIKKLPHFKGKLPAYESEWASGFDIRACLEKSVEIKVGERQLVPSGLSFEIPKGFELQARPRSGLALKKGLSLLNTPGTIDSDYRGEVKILVINLGNETISIQDQERIAQLVLCPIVQAKLEWAKNLEDTKRGRQGFGSTGV